MSSKEKTNKITSFFKPRTNKDTETNEEGDKLNSENSSIIANSNDQRTGVKRKRTEKEDTATSDDNSRELVKSPQKVDSPAPPPALSPEQKLKCVSNKKRAQLVKMSKDLQILTTDIGSSWFEALEDVFKKDWFRKLNDYVLREREAHTIYPSPAEVWSWTTRVSICDVKVVILGQDPYHGPGQAHGLCFSVKPGVAPPPSLVNMFKELERDTPSFTRPGHGYLAGWADQGVLLLNACLTVRKGQANSHKDQGWEKLTDAVISWISKNLTGVVFLLWGAHAQKKAAVVDKSKHHLLTSVHPSPLSAHRGFLGCGHFSKCNELLEAQGKSPVDWTNLPSTSKCLEL